MKSNGPVLGVRARPNTGPFVIVVLEGHGVKLVWRLASSS
jgi:hypothetical protein